MGRVSNARAAFPHHCCLSFLSQDASGAGPGESAGLGPSPLSSVSAVTLGAEPGSGHSDHPAFPSRVGSSLPPCVLSSSAISLPLSELPFPGALLVSDGAAPGMGTGPACRGLVSFQPRGGPELHPETLSRGSTETLLLSLYYFLCLLVSPALCCIVGTWLLNVETRKHCVRGNFSAVPAVTAV